MTASFNRKPYNCKRFVSRRFRPGRNGIIVVPPNYKVLNASFVIYDPQRAQRKGHVQIRWLCLTVTTRHATRRDPRRSAPLQPWKLVFVLVWQAVRPLCHVYDVLTLNNADPGLHARSHWYSTYKKREQTLSILASRRQANSNAFRSVINTVLRFVARLSLRLSSLQLNTLTLKLPNSRSEFLKFFCRTSKSVSI